MKQIDGRLSAQERRYRLRVLETLEQMGTPEAASQLKKLAAQAPGAWFRQQARDSWQRLAKFSPK